MIETMLFLLLEIAMATCHKQDYSSIYLTLNEQLSILATLKLVLKMGDVLITLMIEEKVICYQL